MAIYSYKCPECGHTEDITKPMAESSKEEKCGKCGKTTKRVFSSPGISTGDGRKF